MPLFTLLGDIWYMALAITVFLFFLDRESFKRNMILFVTIMFCTGLIGQLVKHLVSRPRPLKDMAELISGHSVYIHVIGKELRELSFPSGHATTAFSLATFLSLLRIRWMPIFFSLAILTGISRVYMGAHFPLDVLGGMFVGVIVSLAVYFTFKKFIFGTKASGAQSKMDDHR